MFLRLLLLFTLVPLIELYVLIQLAGVIGAGTTVLLVLGTGAAGAWLARREGFRSWGAVQAELAAGRLPAEELLHGLLIVVAGALLVTPGVFTDVFGLVTLIRPVRSAMIRRVQKRIAARIQAGELQVWVAGPPHSGQTGRTGSDAETTDVPSVAGERQPRAGRVIDI